MKKGELKLKNVGKKFKGFWAVKGVTAKFLPQRITGLIGPNGAGKTTLFHLITGELVPDEGDIIYQGESLKENPPWRVARKGIGRMFQDVRVFQGLSVLENIVLALQTPEEEIPFYGLLKKKEKKEEALRWIEFVGLENEIKRKAEDLSYGQQKLLALARIMAGNFDLLLLDEPIAGVSPVITKKILKLLREMVDKYKKTLVIIEHNMNVIMDITDWVYFLNEGRIYFSGRPDHVLGAEEVRRLYLGLVK